jgi:LacI family transcriptional regulator, galactose operon repressor
MIEPVDRRTPGQRPTRLRDVAAAAGVDASVASRVLNGDARLSVRNETRDRVLEAAARLNYRPNRAARALKTARAMAVGMVVPDLANPAFALIALGAEKRAHAAGYTLMLARGSIPASLADLQGRVDGLLVAAATSETVYRRPLFGGIPAILVNREEPGEIASVIVDDEAGAALAIRHLLELGHRRIAHVTGRRRLRGYAAALRAGGVEALPEWVAEASYDEAAGHLAAARLLRVRPRPTALFAANIRIAIGTLSAVRRARLRVPEDVSVIGFDDTPLASYLDPPLTTVRMPLEELGSVAAESLLREIGGRRAESVMVDIPPELVVRGSAAPPPLDATGRGS